MELPFWPPLQSGPAFFCQVVAVGLRPVTIPAIFSDESGNIPASSPAVVNLETDDLMVFGEGKNLWS